MAKIKENLKLECRNIEEYYELMERYKKSGYAIKEEDYDNSKNLNFLQQEKILYGSKNIFKKRHKKEAFLSKLLSCLYNIFLYNNFFKLTFLCLTVIKK